MTPPYERQVLGLTAYYSGWCEERDKFQFYRPGVEHLLGNYEQTVKGKIGANPELTKKVA